jgi:hypothetical protein
MEYIGNHNATSPATQSNSPHSKLDSVISELVTPTFTKFSNTMAQTYKEPWMCPTIRKLPISHFEIKTFFLY